MSVELWKAVFDWGAVVLIGVTFVFGAGALITGKILNDRQDTQLRQLESDLTSAKTDLGKQQVLAADAAGKLAGLEQDAANAKARAATAERSLLELKERMKPRRLTDQQATDFVKALKAFPPGKLTFGHTVGAGDEGFKFLQQLISLFVEARWEKSAADAKLINHLDIQITGVALLVPGPPGSNPNVPAPAEVVKLTPTERAIPAGGIELQFQRWFPNAEEELVVGSKPNQ
jgi:hypothetical protein